MSKHDKRINKWFRNAPTDVAVETVLSVPDRYFPDSYEKKSGSHIVVTDERLKDVGDYGPSGKLTLAVKRGQRVKAPYLTRLAQAIRDLEKETGDSK